jgi:hypothetical protein
MSEPDDDYRPTIDDVDPSALAVNSVDDTVRLHADPTESGIVDSAGETLRVDEDSDGSTVLLPDDGDREVTAETGADGGSARS